MARQGADIGVLEGPFGPEGYLDGASVIKCCYAATGMCMIAAAAVLRESANTRTSLSHKTARRGEHLDPRASACPHGRGPASDRRLPPNSTCVSTQGAVGLSGPGDSEVIRKAVHQRFEEMRSARAARQWPVRRICPGDCIGPRSNRPTAPVNVLCSREVVVPEMYRPGRSQHPGIPPSPTGAGSNPHIVMAGWRGERSRR
jgi:hypothetical protein